MDHLTIIRSDNMVYVDRKPLAVDCSAMPTGHRVLQWHFTSGHIEFADGFTANEHISELPAYAQQLLLDYETAADALAHPDFTIEELREQKALTLDGNFRRSNHSPISFRIDGETYQFETITMVLVDILTAVAFTPPGTRIDWYPIEGVKPVSMDISMLAEIGEAIVHRRETYRAIKMLKMATLARLTTKDAVKTFNTDVP